jgi:hypothetical protein
MKKTAPNSPQSPDRSTFEPIDISKLSEITEPLVSARLRNPNRPDPVSHVFTIMPNIDTESLLCHACETLASLNVMATDLACEVEGSRRNVMLASYWSIGRWTTLTHRVVFLRHRQTTS